MTQQNPLDLKGSFLQHPLAELLVEVGHATLDGSLRLSLEDKKTVVYFDQGNIIFAVSNSKSHRLFNVMLEKKKIDKQTLVKHPNFANDLEFSMSLERSGFSKEVIDEMTRAQIEAILADLLSWPAGEWHFSPLARLRGDIRHQVTIQFLLLEHARTVPNDIVMYRLRNVNEAFILKERVHENLLQSHELHVLSLIGHQPRSIDELSGQTTLPGSGMLQALYVLWLGGIIERLNWSGAFTRTKVEEILSAEVQRIKVAGEVVVANENLPPEAKVPIAKAAELTISLEEFLQRVESAETHYDILGLSNDAGITEIKQMYFGLAKLFHPDKYHREKAETQKRIQSAFTDLAHAYETLKSTESRDQYNFKMRKEIDAREKRRREGQPEPEAVDTRTESALDSFEQGLNLLNDEQYDQAAVLLGRAVHYSPDNAQFHAYYGQALSFFDGQVHKAEGEFQTAIKLDPKNVKIRMMLVDFFIDMDMSKRAIGELNRFLELVPGNRDATSRLERLQRKEQKGPTS